MSDTQRTPLTDALIAHVREKSATDPMLPMRMTAREIVDFSLERLADDKGVHVETLFALLGALAMPDFDPMDIETFSEINVATGERYVLGKLINVPMFEDKLSFWQLVIAGAKSMGARDLPDANEMVMHVVKTFGTDQFAQPRVPVGHQPALPPLDLLRQFGPDYLPRLTIFTDRARDIPVSLAFAAQTLMDGAKEVITPDLAARITLEAAVPLSRAHPDDIFV